MNLFFKSYRIFLIFFLLLAWETCFTSGIAQENTLYLSPWIQEIKLPAPYSEIPNVSCYQDQKGTIFLGKENGLTIVNGKDFNHLHLNGPVYVTGGDSDTLFYAAENDLGFLIRGVESNFQIHSRKHVIPSSQRTFVPSGLVELKGHLFMNTNHGVYHLQGRKVRFYPMEETDTRLHQVYDKLYLTAKGRGILLWTGQGFREMVSKDQLEGNAILLGAGEQQTLRILSTSGKIYELQGQESKPLYKMELPFANRLTFIDIVKGTQLFVELDDSEISLVDLNKKKVYERRVISGLPHNEIIQVFSTANNEIWILGPHSLHRINDPSPLNILTIQSEISGQIQSSIIIDNQIFIGTSKGLFKLRPDRGASNQWNYESLLTEINESIHLLSSFGNQLYAAGLHHLYSIRTGAVNLMDEGSVTGMLPLDENTLLVSGEKGLLTYSRNNQGGWNATFIDRDLSYAHSFVLHDQQAYFLSQNSIFRFSRNTNKVAPILFHSDKLLYKLSSLEDRLFLLAGNQVYQYEKNEETFLPLNGEHKTRMLLESQKVVPENEGNYWILQQNHVSRISDRNPSYPVLQMLDEVIDLHYHDSLLFITSKNSIALFDPSIQGLNKNEGHLHIEQVSHSKQKIEFSLAGLDFQADPKPLFRYRLLPGDDQWTEWRISRLLTFTFLRPDDYQLEVQSMDLFGNVTSTVEHRFEITPPLHRTWYAYVVYAILLLVGLFLLRKWQLLSYQNAESKLSLRVQTRLKEVALEKEVSDKLKTEIVPQRTGDQAKSKAKSKWDKYERATVLFSDIQGFTKIAEEMNPEALIDELDKFFFHFDSVVDKYNIEKIKTIGDAYMAAGGIPKKNSTNPVEVILAALEMQSYMQHLKSAKADIWDLRIGIHTGPVIAGVVGHKKLSYDIWGDTVNTASRMESSGTPGKVNISGITYGMVKEYFICEYRGKLPVKYKGNIDMYYVTGLRPELSVDLKGIPNKRFFTKLQLLRLGDLENLVFDDILSNLPESLHFHTVDYARKVYNQSFLLCRAEEIEQSDRLLVRTAALMLFTGLTQSYNNFENRTSVLSREILPDFQYSDTQIDQICNLVLSTKLPFNPGNRLEKILIDTKMDYIGGPDYTANIKRLFLELKETGSKINGQQFKKHQLELLYGFEFYTIAGQRLREVSGTDQMATLEQERWI